MENGEWPKKQIQFLSRRNRKKKEMKNRLTRDVLAFEFFVDVVKHQKASSLFFVSGYSRFLLPLTYLSNIHWWKCLNSLNLKEFNHCRNIRIQR